MDPSAVIAALISAIVALSGVIAALAKRLYDNALKECALLREENAQLKQERLTTDRTAAENSTQALTTLTAFYQAWRESVAVRPRTRRPPAHGG